MTAAHYRLCKRQEPWQIALKRLSRNGYSDAQIAEILSDLSDEKITLLEANNVWIREMIEESLAPESGAYQWSKRLVCYHRRRLGLESKGRKWECGNPATTVQVRVNLAAGRMGWGHLAPLTPGELRLIDALAEGPGTRAELEKRSGLILDASRYGGNTPLKRLIARGIIVTARVRYHQPVYALASSIRRRGPDQTGIAELAELLRVKPALVG